ncbi:glycosyltransferase family 2 protein [Luteolibacter marinus]|uniref:glycosyltransferase family 2 protein n=1 Tax=Luteolibacter marinus TaxID=2776705 RepID=UPI001869467A|nr:glycosyltransferase [Luteolibacter marinus]
MPQASIVIVTRNRRDELRRALLSAARQDGGHEVIVVDDASDDGSADMVGKEFPDFRLIRSSRAMGYIVQRNRAARMARGEFIVSIDDDAEFSSPTIVNETIGLFTDLPSVGAVAIPYSDGPDHVREFQRAPDHENCWITGQFIGTAHALRRDLFLQLDGYDERLIHQGEERDFCLRMLAQGFFVRLGTSAAIRHHRSPRRDLRRMAYFGRRNDVLFVWRHVPFPQVIGRLLGTLLRGSIRGLFDGTIATTLKGIAAGLTDIIGGAGRHPVGRDCYAKYRQLRGGTITVLPGNP